MSNRKSDLYAAIEALLPFASVEIDLLADFVQTVPEDKNHETDVKRAEAGLKALADARKLLDSRTRYMKGKRNAMDT